MIQDSIAISSLKFSVTWSIKKLLILGVQLEAVGSLWFFLGINPSWDSSRILPPKKGDTTKMELLNTVGGNLT